MQYYFCKCGEHTAWGSMPMPSCFECEKCHTTLEVDPSLHRRAIPHEWVVTSVKTDEGNKPLSRCRLCWQNKNEIEAGGA
jgi:hypothetical protein